jgi:hypothetical protein
MRGYRKDGLLMREWDSNPIRPLVEAWDTNGEPIGVVAHIYTPALAARGGDRSGLGESIIEVKTGFLGLGTRYYIPERAIADVTESGVVLTVARSALDDLGWQTKPAELDDRL